MFVSFLLLSLGFAAAFVVARLSSEMVNEIVIRLTVSVSVVLFFLLTEWGWALFAGYLVGIVGVALSGLDGYSSFDFE